MMKEAVCAVFLIFAVSCTSSQKVACSVGWVVNGTSCYYVETNLTQKRNFWQAKKWCKEANSTLTTVLSEGENDFLDHLINKTDLRPNETFYIGLRTLNNDSKLVWVGGMPYNKTTNYSNWLNNSEPVLTANDTQQRCAYYNHEHTWQLEHGCGIARLFICKQLQSNNNEQPTSGENVTPGNNNNGNNNGNTGENVTPGNNNNGNNNGNTGHTKSTKPTTPSVKGSAGTNDSNSELEETLKKIDKTLDELEGVPLNESSAMKHMETLGTDLDSAVNSGSQSTAQLSELIVKSERIGEVMAKGLRKGKNITEPTSVKVQTGSLVLGVALLPAVPYANSSESVYFPEENKQTDNINLPASLMWKAQRQDGVSISNLVISSVSVTADPKSSKVLNSGIISSTILFNNGSKFENLSDPVVISLSSLKKANDDSSLSCVFLDLNTNPSSWSSSGCVIHSSSSSRTVCHCNHMTSFAVLMDVHGAYEDDAISEEHQLTLSIISIVGCLIAFICYIALLFSFYFLRKRTETLCIHMNLAAAQSLAIFFFLVGFPGVRIKGVCYAFALLLHYFQLASFCWMMVEGVNLLRGMVKVFRVTSRLKIYSLFSWGLPIIVVAITASLSQHEYLREDFCWISHQVIWSFAGPVALILSVNLAALVVAIKIVVRRTRYKENDVLSAVQLEIRAAFKTLVILVPLLGVTWILGYVSIHDKSLVFQYLFAVVNSLQGLYFLIAQYCFDDDIKTNAHRASSRVKRMFTLSKSTSGSFSGSHNSYNKKTAVSPEENPAYQEDKEKNISDTKQSLNDQHNHHKDLGCNQQSDLNQESELNAIPCQLQDTTTDQPDNQADSAQGEVELEKNHNETRF